MTERQPVYVAYAEAHGRTPQGQYDHDCRRFGHFSGVDFICWVSERQRKWEAETGETLTPSTRASFHAWLGAS